MSAEVQVLSYDTIAHTVKLINKQLLKQEGGILLRVKVNKRNEVQHIDFCGVDEAMSNGISFDGLVSKA